MTRGSEEEEEDLDDDDDDVLCGGDRYNNKEGMELLFELQVGS